MIYLVQSNIFLFVKREDEHEDIFLKVANSHDQRRPIITELNMYI